MDELLITLAKLRHETEAAKDMLKRMENDLVSSQDYQNAANVIDFNQRAIETLTASIKSEALIDYEAFRQKSIKDGAVKIKVFTDAILTYDPAQAKTWAMALAPALVALDKKKFEDYAKKVAEVNPVEFVTIETKERIEAQIASDLSNWLPKSEPAVELGNIDSNIPF